MENSVLSPQFCHESKTALKNKVNKKLKQTNPKGLFANPFYPKGPPLM